MLEVSKFITFYEHSSRKQGHLDEIARHMGWEVSDWSNKDGYTEEDLSEFPSMEEEDFEPSEPYTLHRHPVYIVTQGLFYWLRNSFNDYLEKSLGRQVSARIGWNYATALQETEQQAVMGIQALDMADYSLAICHFKRALSGINQTMAILEELFPDNIEEPYRKEIQIRLFDLREVYLRIIGECRYFENGDFNEPF